MISQKINLEIKSEFNKSTIKYNWYSDLGKSSNGNSKINFSIGVNIELNNLFSLKTTAGTADFSNHIYKSWNSNESLDFIGNKIDFKSEHELKGDILIIQNFFEIMPEIHLLDKWLFINAGFGVFSIRSNTFSNGYYFSYPQYTNRKEIPKFLGQYLYVTFNLGFNQKIFNHLYLIGEIGYRISNKTRKAVDYPGIGINQVIAKIGLAYDFH